MKFVAEAHYVQPTQCRGNGHHLVVARFVSVEWTSSFRRRIYSKPDWIVEMGNIPNSNNRRLSMAPHTRSLAHWHTNYVALLLLLFGIGQLIRFELVWLCHFSMVRWASRHPKANAKNVIICFLFFFFFVEWHRRAYESSNELVNCGFDSMEMGDECLASFVIICYD